MKLRTFLAGSLLVSALSGGPASAQATSGPAPAAPARANAAAVELFDRAGQVSPRDVYKTAAELYAANDLESARLLAMRVFLDGHRSSNLLDLLGAIEIKAGRELLAGEWLRKALSLNAEDMNARKLLARLPPAPRPIPVESGNLPDHFSGITRKLPLLLQRLTTPRQHFDAVFDEITRGQFYKALALAEEYEKRYPGIDGTALTALCALYLGRLTDAEQLVTPALTQSRHHSLLLFVKAMLTDLNPETSAPSRPRALYDLDRVEEALQAADAWTAAFPRSAEGLLVKTRIALDRLQGQAARAVLDAAMQRDPDHPMLGLLSSEFALLRGQPIAAAEALKKAARRGYHLPSISLANGLFLAKTGQTEEARAILEEIDGHRPFLDREAYPLFVRLAVVTGRLPAARTALDEWRKRHSLNSLICFAEALYQNAVGQPDESRNWLGRGMQLNPGNALAKALAGGEAVNLTMGDTGTPVAKSVPATVEPAPAPLPTPAAAPPAAPPPAPETRSVPAAQPAPAAVPEPVSTVSGPRFNLAVGQGVPPENVEAVRAAVTAGLDQAESLLGIRGAGLNVHLVDTNGLGSRVAVFDPETGQVQVSMLCNDPATIKAFLDGERPDLDEETRVPMAQGISGHLIAGSLAQSILYQKVKNLKTVVPQYRWLMSGVAEIAGGNDAMLRDILGSTQVFMASGAVKLLPVEGINEALAPGFRDAVKLITARAQSYLMVAFLVKKGTNHTDGFARVVKLLQQLAAGQPFKNALKAAFGISESEFESGWKEAAFWSLKQGIPYEW